MVTQVISPEDLLSLKLKAVENGFSSDNLDEFQIYDEDKVYDIIDEADAVLSYKYQLVYTMETDMHKKCHLADGDIRWKCAQKLLNILNHDLEVQNMLSNFSLDNPEGFHLKEEENNFPGRYQNIRLVETTSNKQAECRKKLQQLLFRKLIHLKCNDFGWIFVLIESGVYSEEDMISSVSNIEKPIHEILVSKNSIFDINAPENHMHMSQLLAFRGYLGNRILEFCLEYRYRVNYGLDSSRKKRLAVPYLAADQPSKRSEFAHPDVGIVKTCLSYYYEGLTRGQLLAALKLLLKLGPSAQHIIYGSWLGRIQTSNYDAEKLKKIDNFRKIDVSNASLFEILYDTYRYTMETIDFWLNNFVFPTDTAQYPYRIMMSSFNIAHERAIGFSGTRDMRFLLPLPMCQKEPDSRELEATDGKMLAMMLSKSEYTPIKTKPDQPLWQTLLDMVVTEKADALIDAGSLLAGISNSQAAAYLRDKVQDSDYKGIIYFETNCERPEGNWYVLNVQTEECQPKADSAIRDWESIVIYDDARTRGSDMKLRDNALGLLTIGPKIIKDKLVQAAGRMRLLEAGQRLRIVATKDVEARIKALHGAVNVLEILKWVISNTKASNIEGLSQWTSNGLLHRREQLSAKSALIKEEWSLKALYSQAFKPIPLSEKILKNAKAFLSNNLDEQMISSINGDAKCDKIVQYAQSLCGLVEVVDSSMDNDEECEREQQLEVEREEEREIEVSKIDPHKEAPWNYQSALETKNVGDLERLLGKTLIRLNTCQPKSIKWDDSIYLTPNFMQTTKSSRFDMLYARNIDFVFIYDQTNEIVAFSDQEAEGILRAFWETKKQEEVGRCFRFLNVSIVRMNICQNFLLGKKDVSPTKEALASMELFNGNTNFDAGMKEPVRKALRTKLSKTRVQEIVRDRGRVHFFPLSTLEQICKDIKSRLDE